MTEYAPPLTDIRFVLEDVCDLPELLQQDDFNHVEADMIFAVLDEVGRFAAEVIAPNRKPAKTQHQPKRKNKKRPSQNFCGRSRKNFFR